MLIELSDKEISDIGCGLLIAMKELDKTGTSLDKVLSDRLEAINKRLDEINK